MSNRLNGVIVAVVFKPESIIPNIDLEIRQ